LRSRSLQLEWLLLLLLLSWEGRPAATRCVKKREVTSASPPAAAIGCANAWKLAFDFGL